MKAKALLQCTLDLTEPVAEIVAVISTVTQMIPDQKAEIMRALDMAIGIELAEMEERANEGGSGGVGNGK